MPRRPVLGGTSISPRTSSNAVNEVFDALSRKLNVSQSVAQIEQVSTPAPPRRPSFSMENILHPHRKDKKHEEKERDSRKDKRSSAMTQNNKQKSKDRVSGPSPHVGPVKPGKFELIVESPPLVFYGNHNNSSGALFSGRMSLAVDDPTGKVTLESFTMILRATITTKKPIGKDCRSCAERHDELKKWNFLSEPKSFSKGGNNQFPFSYLFPGNLPATTHAQLGSLTYQLCAVATTTTGENIEFKQELILRRAIQPGPDKASIRIFPPTNLTGRVTLPPIVHPIGTFPVQMTLTGIVEKKSESQTRWRLRKMMWRVEEHSKVISTPCTKHAGKVSDGKALQHTETKVLGNDELKAGWKTDFDTLGGEIALEFDASIATRSTHKATCAMQSPAGLEVKHNLVIELIVAEEFCPNRNTSLITPTGAARVLRMQFALVVTERAGMGISWDEEQPPMYEDVPPSPPGYDNASKAEAQFGGAFIEDYDGPTIEPLDLERISTENPNDPPVYRERSAQEVYLNAGLPMRSRASARSDSDAGSSGVRRLTGFRLDELEAEPMHSSWRDRQQNEHEDAIQEDDFGEGEAGAAQ